MDKGIQKGLHIFVRFEISDEHQIFTRYAVLRFYSFNLKRIVHHLDRPRHSVRNNVDPIRRNVKQRYNVSLGDLGNCDDGRRPVKNPATEKEIIAIIHRTFDPAFFRQGQKEEIVDRNHLRASAPERAFVKRRKKDIDAVSLNGMGQGDMIPPRGHALRDHS